MKKTVMVILTIALVVLTAEPAAFAQDETRPEAQPEMTRPYGMMGRGLGIGTGYLRLQEELGLTADQISKLESLRLEGQKEMIQIKADLQVKHLELSELMKAQGNDDAVKAKSAEIQSIMNKMAAMRTSHQLSHRAVFTAEQWQKVSSLKGMMYSRMDRGYRDGMRGHRSSMRSNRSSGRGLGTPRGRYNR